MIKKILYAILNVISVAAIALAVVALLAVVLTPAGEAPSVFGYSAMRVLTGSMEPEIKTNTLIIVKKTAPEQIAVGDIISFYSADPALGGSINTHRVVEAEQANGEWTFTTQGDANPIADKYPATGQNLVGKVVFSSHVLGVAVAFLTQPIAFLLLVIIPLVGMTAYNFYKVIHSANKVLKEEEKAAVQQALDDLRQKQAGSDEEQPPKKD